MNRGQARALRERTELGGIAELTKERNRVSCIHERWRLGHGDSGRVQGTRGAGAAGPDAIPEHRATEPSDGLHVFEQGADPESTDLHGADGDRAHVG